MLDGAAAVWGSFHHEGPYDCAYRERNTRKGYAPVDALRESNAATLRSTPPVYIMESLLCQKPLRGCATYPPGSVDYDGVEYNYEQFEMQILDRQNYSMMPRDKRCPKTELPPEQRVFQDEGNPNGLTWFWDWFRAYRKKRKERKKQKERQLGMVDSQKDEGLK
ncbi:hypothetical protein KEM54_005545 [Ascosphaera aggregata]|nr:hypothetical protein KEM54_005545 [Ascosphaera aggregata]